LGEGEGRKGNDGFEIKKKKERECYPTKPK
jgi:hypothetical protein